MNGKGDYARGDVYWADLEPTKGAEEGKSRPIIIISNNLMNKVAPIILGIPMSRKGEKLVETPFNIPYDISLMIINTRSVEKLRANGHYFSENANGSFLCNQVRALSKKRLIERIGSFKTDLYIMKIEDALKDSLGIGSCSYCNMPLNPRSTHCGNPKCRRKQRNKCKKCHEILPLNFKYCFKCGEEVK